MYTLLNLIQLEFRKNRIIRYLTGVAIANAVFAAFMFLIYFASRSEGAEAFPSFLAAASNMDQLMRMTFMIFASVLIARMIVEEYRSKTITLLFMYPISRKKLIAAKLIIVFIFVFGSMLLSSLFLQALLYTADLAFGIVPESLTWGEGLRLLFKIVLSSLSTAGISLIPLYFGMRKKSVPATIVSAIILNAVLSMGGDAVSLGSIPAVSLALAAVGLLIAYLSIRDLDMKDIV